jgi:TRAP-type mannitol/chloroaromatic compound transport system permease small subunit
MMIGEGSMMIGVALSWLLIVIVLVLVGAAAFKYLFYHPTNRQTEVRRGTTTVEPPVR